MSLFKRIEVWVLILLLGVGLFFVLNSGDPDAPETEGKEATAKTEKYGIKKLSLRRDYGNYELRISVDYNNKDGEEIDTASAAALMAEGDRKIPAFFLAIAPPPTIPAGKRETVELKYWLEADDLKGPLWLDVAGSRAQVKADASFDGESIENGETESLTLSNWAIK